MAASVPLPVRRTCPKCGTDYPFRSGFCTVVFYGASSAFNHLRGSCRQPSCGLVEKFFLGWHRLTELIVADPSLGETMERLSRPSKEVVEEYRNGSYGYQQFDIGRYAWQQRRWHQELVGIIAVSDGPNADPDLPQDWLPYVTQSGTGQLGSYFQDLVVGARPTYAESHRHGREFCSTCDRLPR